MSQQKLSAYRQYQNQRLSIHTEREIRGGGAYVAPGFWYGFPYGWGLGGVVVSEPVEITHGWGVYQGPHRLTVPDFLAAAGDQSRQQALQSDIDRLNRARTAWYAVAGVGAAAMLTGVFGTDVAEDWDTWRTYSNVGWAGALVAVTGVVGGSFPASKATRLARVPEASMTPEDAAGLVDAHNEKLAEELGLSPDEVWQIEAGSPPRR